MMMRRFTAAAAALAASAGMAQAQSFTEAFDDIVTLSTSGGWFTQNNSSPIGLTNYFQGNLAVFAPQASAGYLGTNFNNGAGLATISNWFVTPVVNLQNGQTFSFWTRTVDGPFFPDRLQVRMSLAGASTNVGALGNATAVGDFTNLLLDINPTYLATGTGSYPNVWTQFTVTITGVPASTPGRLAFRYFVENAGPSGANSDYIGIDTAEYVGMAVPTGACCLPNGDCAPGISQNSCTGQGGTYQGDGSVCNVPNTCPQPATGSCCLPDGTCISATSVNCTAQNGIWGGANSACGTANCAKAFVYVGAAVPIADGTGSTACGATATASVTVGQSFPITGIEAAYFITHTFQGDLIVNLSKSGGPSVNMVDRPGVPASTFGFGTDNFGASNSNAGYFISNDTAANIYDAPATAGVNNPVGRWKSEGAMAPFVGLDSAGTWNLNVTDCAGGDTGNIVGFILLLKMAPSGGGCYANCDAST
ncbi:MAG: choice-of-anchor J domain-containing protein, partial [Phycisphaerae bacterium]|nr:choice-of-anchor J domain-containing protein [Phycisphaerae bacterium]